MEALLAILIVAPVAFAIGVRRGRELEATAWSVRKPRADIGPALARSLRRQP